MHGHPSAPFHGEKLRLARLLSGLSLDELGGAVSASRQFIHQLETEAKEPSPEMRAALGAALRVRNSFFERPAGNQVRDDDCHFRRLLTAPRSIILQAVARGTLAEMIITALSKRVRFPSVNFPDVGHPTDFEAVERAAEEARLHWHLGLDGPITNMTRVVENAGAVVVHFADMSEKIDALSIARRRPLIVRSSVKHSAVRLRFDLAHECGHLVMHQGIVTGDRDTELQAHRFAGAFLFPRTAFAKEFPRGRRTLDWSALYAMKLRWRVSVRALVRRAFDLELIDAAQYRTANIHLMKTGQSRAERHDDVLQLEEPEALPSAVNLLAARDPAAFWAVLAEVGVAGETFERVVGVAIPPLPENVMLFSGD